MRTALNKVAINGIGRYGDFDIARINRDDTRRKRSLKPICNAGPQGGGGYTDLPRNMLRRINWYLQAWPQLAGLYEQGLPAGCRRRGTA